MEELLSALDEAGIETGASVPRSVAHRSGVWHRSVGLIVLNSRGEILMEKRAEHKDLFPGAYDIPGGHVESGGSDDEAAQKELQEEIKLDLSADRLVMVGPHGGVVERVVIPSKAILNLERKTVYMVELSETEEQQCMQLAADRAGRTEADLATQGAHGEVSALEFWCVEAVEAAVSTNSSMVASGTVSVFADDYVSNIIKSRCLELRISRRRRVFDLLPSMFGSGDNPDTFLVDQLTGRPRTVASSDICDAVFVHGRNTTAGAYRVGEFRARAVTDAYWQHKLADTYDAYVGNIFRLIRHRTGGSDLPVSDEDADKAKYFVSELMNLPLLNGSRLRDAFGNLTEITAARNAALMWLAHSTSGAASHPVDRHLSWLVDECLTASRQLLQSIVAIPPLKDRKARVRHLVRASLGACAAEFNSIDFQNALRGTDSLAHIIEQFCRESAPARLSQDLGGEGFFSQFFGTCSSATKPLRIAYLTGNSCQAYLSLAICQELLHLNEHITISMIPKGLPVGNDTEYSSLLRDLRNHGHGYFSDLLEYEKAGRFSISPDGPTTNGLDVSRLSSTCAVILRDSDIVWAEGQAYAEIRGWRKQAYVSFRANGRVAQAVHGVQRGTCGLVGIIPEVDHFTDLTLSRGPNTSASSNTVTYTVRQTTVSYVRAGLSNNLELIVKELFHGDGLAATRQITAEALRTARTFAEVVLGVQGPVDPKEAIAAYAALEFPVFAAGGGGGFNAVTLRALKMLDKPVVAGVPSSDDGGSSGELQKWMRSKRGFVFGVGDMAAVLQDAVDNGGKQAVLAYRLDNEPPSLCNAVLEKITDELRYPTYTASPLGASADLIHFVTSQLNLARIIDGAFRRNKADRMPVRGASIRNLNVIAAYESCNSLGTANPADATNGLAAFHLLQECLDLPKRLLVLPVTYEPAVLYVRYQDPISPELCASHGIPETSLSADRRTLYGQHYIDILPHPGPRLMVGVVDRPASGTVTPSANPEYLARLRNARLFVIGAGSLISSQLSQLAVDGVIRALLDKQDCRRILIINHVMMDETSGMHIRDQVRLIEAVANRNTQATRTDGSVGRQDYVIGDLFTDIVIPRTVAHELESEMALSATSTGYDGKPDLRLSAIAGSSPKALNRNRFIDYLDAHREAIDRLGITRREVEVLAALESDPKSTMNRTESGRYRGPLFASRDDVEYLTRHGIQARHIHEIDSIGENWKLLKAEGSPSFEFFPGLVPESLMAIIKIAMEPGTELAQFV